MNADCFPEAPTEWPKVPISALAEVNPRYPVRKGQEYPFVEMAAVGENFGGVLGFDTRKMEGSGLSRFKAGDTLFAKITPCPENGKVAHLPELPGEVGLGSTEFIVLAPRDGQDARFLYHLLCSHAVRGRAVARMEGSTGRQRVPEDVFQRQLLVPLLQRDEQTSIARVLDAVDAAACKMRDAIASATVLRRALMQELLPPWIGFRHVDGPVPEGVEEVTIAKDVADVCNGSTPSRVEGRYWRDGEIPWLATGKVHDRVITAADEFVTQAALLECSIELLPRGTVLVGMIGQGRTRGMAAYLDMEACINQNFGAFVPKRKVYGKWLFYYLDYHYQRVREVGGGTNQGALNCYLLKRIRFPLPTMEKQKEVASILDAAEELERSRRAVLRHQLSLKTALLQDLLTGKVRVSHLNFNPGGAP